MTKPPRINRQLQRFTLSAVGLAAFFGPGIATCQAAFRIIAQDGQITPNNRGTFSVLIGPPVLSESGRVVFPARVAGAPFGSSEDTGLFAYTPTSGLRQIVRENDREIDFTGQSGNNGLFDDLGVHRQNRHFTVGQGGDVVFISDLKQTTGGPNDDSGFYRDANGALSRIAREDAPFDVGTGEFDRFTTAQFTADWTSVNSYGDVAFEASVRNAVPSFDDAVIVLSRPGQAPHVVVRELQSFGATEKFSSFGSVHINDKRQITFTAQMTGAQANVGVFRITASGSATSAPVSLFREGNVMPGRGYAVTQMHTGLIHNNMGDFAFRADTGPAPSPDVVALYTSGNLRQAALEGVAPPEGNGVFNNQFVIWDLNDDAHLLFQGQVKNSNFGTTDDDGIYLYGSQQLRNVARENALVPEGGGRFDNFNYDTMAQGGGRTVAFTARLRNTPGEITRIDDDEALYHFDGVLRKIVREADLLPGGNHVTYVDEHLSMNQLGELLYLVRLSPLGPNATGENALFLYADGVSRELLREGDVVGGKTINDISANFTLNDNGQIAAMASASGVGDVILMLDPNADFNGNGRVGGEDFLAWQAGIGKQTGASKSQGDADCDHDVDRRDYRFWQEQFGTRGGAVQLAAVGSVPEPCSGILLLIAVSLQPVARRRGVAGSAGSRLRCRRQISEVK